MGSLALGRVGLMPMRDREEEYQSLWTTFLEPPCHDCSGAKLGSPTVSRCPLPLGRRSRPAGAAALPAEPVYARSRASRHIGCPDRTGVLLSAMPPHSPGGPPVAACSPVVRGRDWPRLPDQILLDHSRAVHGTGDGLVELAEKHPLAKVCRKPWDGDTSPP